MRTLESDRTVSDLMFDDAALMTAERTAMASAIKAEEIEPWVKLMIGSGGEMFPLKMPPIPQVSVTGIHAASTQQDGPEI